MSRLAVWLSTLLVFFLLGCDKGTPLLTESGTDLAVADKSGSTSAETGGRYLVLMASQGIARGLAGNVEALGGRLEFTHGTGIAIVGGLSEAGAGQLRGLAGVTAVVPERQTRMELPANPVTESVTPASPEDPTGAYFWSRQWNMRAIGADKAWEAGRLGSDKVTVAILDSGIDYLYPDLVGRVDLSRSVSFVPSDDELVATYFPSRHPITDLHYHGTHVAATVASNALLAAGVTSKVTLMGVKVCSVEGSCSDGAIFAGLLHAADQGADVINMSLGGSFPKWIAREEKDYAGFVGFLFRVMNYVNSKGVTVVVSAGNAAIDLDKDGPSLRVYNGLSNTIGVSATDYQDLPTSYTNYGRSAVNVAAPGGSSVAGVPSAQTFIYAGCSTSSLVLPICQTAYYVLGMAGTSMATPHVTGLAALLVEDVGRNPGRIKTRIQQGADDLGLKGVDPFFGKGRINIPKTLMP